MNKSSPSSTYKIVLGAGILLLIIAFGMYGNLTKTSVSSNLAADIFSEYMQPKSASAAINWSSYPPEVLTLLGLPKTVQNPGTTMTNAEQRMFNAQTYATLLATGVGKSQGLTAAQSMTKYYCTFFKQTAATAPKATGGNYFVGFGGQKKLWMGPYTPYPTKPYILDSGLPHQVSVFEQAYGIDVPNTPLVGLPIC